MRAPVFLACTLVFSSACQEYSVFTDTREEDIHQSFTIEGAKSDILFYGDTSDSMTRELRSLGDEVQLFINRLAEAQSDWQILAVTGPDGCGQGGILTKDTPDVAAKFADGILTPPEQTSADEWGLFNVFKAAMASSPGGCNEGFLRRDAALHVIFISDEDDNSPGWNAFPDSYWRDYVDPIKYLKDDAQLVRFSAIAGPVPGGCDGADEGLGYADAVEDTGGEFLSICSEWETELPLLADASITQAFFPLDWEPFEETLAVSVNGEPRETGWAYIPERQGVEFTEGVPRAYDTVDILYRALVEFEVTE